MNFEINSSLVSSVSSIRASGGSWGVCVNPLAGFFPELLKNHTGVSGRKSTRIVRKSEAELYIKMTIGRVCGSSNNVP